MYSSASHRNGVHSKQPLKKCTCQILTKRYLFFHLTRFRRTNLINMSHRVCDFVTEIPVPLTGLWPVTYRDVVLRPYKKPSGMRITCSLDLLNNLIVKYCQLTNRCPHFNSNNLYVPTGNNIKI